MKTVLRGVRDYEPGLMFLWGLHKTAWDATTPIPCRDLLAQEARDERLAHMVALVLAALTGKSTAAFGKAKMPKLRAPTHSNA